MTEGMTITHADPPTRLAARMGMVGPVVLIRTETHGVVYVSHVKARFRVEKYVIRSGGAERFVGYAHDLPEPITRRERKALAFHRDAAARALVAQHGRNARLL